MIKKITTEQLQLGMHLHKFCADWLDHPFWKSDFLIENEADLKKIKVSKVKDVLIDTKKGLDVPGVAEASVQEQQQADSLSTSKPDEVTKPVSIEQEKKRAARIYAKSKQAMRSMFEEARMGKAIDASMARDMVNEISASVMSNTDALISITRLKSADEYTYMHSVAVCALMIALAKQLGMNQDECKQAGLAGLMHDVGKAKIPDEIINKPGKLTDEEYAIVQTHPAEGYKILKQEYDLDGVVLDVVLHHHEKVDGKGYPKGLSNSQLSQFARMGAICDVYDAVTSNRPYKEGWSPGESLKRMSQWKGHFDEKIFHAFVKSIGIYPVGSFVMLDSGRMGVVIEQHATSLLSPKVKVFYSSKNSTYLMPETIDLAKAGTKEKIVSPEDPNEWGIRDFNDFWAE